MSSDRDNRTLTDALIGAAPPEFYVIKSYCPE
jgi:hypothetical protein